MTNSKKKSKLKNQSDLSEEQVLEIIENQPEDIQKSITKTLVAEQVSYTGPIPPPSLLKQFDDVIPDGADRIMKMAESQSAHRIKIEESVVRANNRDSFLGVLFGGFISLIATIGAIYLISQDKSIQGFIVLIGSLATLVGVYLKGSSEDKKDLQDKDNNN